MKQIVLVTGGEGQLGRELAISSGPNIECVAVARGQLDIGNPQSVARMMAELKPQVVINAAAYTAVDKAESEAAQARRVNALGPGFLAAACREQGARMIHVSTDFVFDGESSRPYSPVSPPCPIGEYGRSKLAGEVAVHGELPGALTVRTAWLYSDRGANFVKTML
ncbi:MAG: sugar nucleotide-binding protein, partial [Halieaceae bacterium]|nr:sugar nucleotide-binding protein [Halieaceae bacterium]